MRAGLASGHVASAPMMRRVDAILARHAAISQDDGDLEAHAFDELAPALKLADALQMPEVWNLDWRDWILIEGNMWIVLRMLVVVSAVFGFFNTLFVLFLIDLIICRCMR